VHLSSSPRGYDLHCHSTASDGSLAPAALVHAAAARGVRLLALTDHDTTEGLVEAAAAAQAAGVTLVPGVELSVRWGSRELHLLGLGMSVESSGFAALLERQAQARAQRAVLIGRRLDAAAGVLDSYARASQLADSPAPGRPHFAKVLVDAGSVRDENHAFNRFLARGQSAFVSTQWVSLVDAVVEINQAGGIAVLAHPGHHGLTRKKLRQLLAEMCHAGRCGLEVRMPGISIREFDRLAECLRDFPLLASAGSDFHSPGPWRQLGHLPDFPAGAVPVWEGFSMNCP